MVKEITNANGGGNSELIINQNLDYEQQIFENIIPNLNFGDKGFGEPVNH